MSYGTAEIIRGDARHLPLADDSVDLIVTSPPYFGLRSYTDAGEHYDGQIGSEPTPAEFLDALVEVTRECMRVLKSTGSLWVNLGDKYSDRAGPEWAGSSDRLTSRPPKPRRASSTSMAPRKSLLGLPWRYAIRCIDELGLILREEVVWSKPNGLPESVTDRARRSHEQWFHFTLKPRYFSAVDEIREPHSGGSNYGRKDGGVSQWAGKVVANGDRAGVLGSTNPDLFDPRGKMPGSVWVVPTEPLKVPEWLDVDHFAAFPTELPRRIVLGWSPREICVKCGDGRRPVAQAEYDQQGRTTNGPKNEARKALADDAARAIRNGVRAVQQTIIADYACACAEPTAATRPSVVLDPFGGTGTTALVAKALGRHGISVDMSADYCRLAEWRTTDPDQLAKAARAPKPKIKLADDQVSALDLLLDSEAAL